MGKDPRVIIMDLMDASDACGVYDAMAVTDLNDVMDFTDLKDASDACDAYGNMLKGLVAGLPNQFVAGLRNRFIAGLLNRFIGPYVTNLNLKQLNVAWTGDIKLTDLELKKDVLDKFGLPIDVDEGYLGELTLSISWSNWKNKPVKVYINNVYLLCVPKGESEYVEAARAQAPKEVRLTNAELLNTKPTVGVNDEEKNNAILNQLITKVVDNLQVSISNIQVRYKDKNSDPEHPFSASLELSQISVVSTDGEWVPTFIHDEANKLATMAFGKQRRSGSTANSFATQSSKDSNTICEGVLKLQDWLRPYKRLDETYRLYAEPHVDQYGRPLYKQGEKYYVEVSQPAVKTASEKARISYNQYAQPHINKAVDAIYTDNVKA
ncbi:hypothetical protein BG006_001955 [Podila minutissima]|uniref:Chorein N-terminal domain-containing protein n=1 Tax=Podila minutissima TaxID=64525 RepID=A0A9P5S9Q7_9FUNG|nr:hypothetical protein BG006_001955 [Podila minutissima]